VNSAALYDGTVAGWTRSAVVSGEQVLDQRVDSAVAFAAQLGVFVERKILRPTNFLGLQKGSRSFAPELIEFLALHSIWHVCRFYRVYRRAQEYVGTVNIARNSKPPSQSE